MANVTGLHKTHNKHLKEMIGMNLSSQFSSLNSNNIL